MSNVLTDISLHTDTQHSAVNLSSYQFIWEIISTSKLTIFEAVFQWNIRRRLSAATQSDASDGIEQPASLFLILCMILCPQWSASGKPWGATDDAVEATNDFFYISSP